MELYEIIYVCCVVPVSLIAIILCCFNVYKVTNYEKSVKRILQILKNSHYRKILFLNDDEFKELFIRLSNLYEDQEIDK